MKHVLSRSSLFGVLGATAALVAVTFARGGDNGNEVAINASATTAPSNSGSVGLLVAKDPVTGALRAPTAEEVATLQSLSPKQRAAKSAVRQLPNGVLAKTIDPSFDLYSVAVKGADGKVSTACVPEEKVEVALQAAQQGGLTKTEVLDEK